MADSEMYGNEKGREFPAAQAYSAPGRKKRVNMHEGIGVWCDCCSCEAEPYWAELANEMGVNLSDYEDESKPPEAKK